MRDYTLVAHPAPSAANKVKYLKLELVDQLSCALNTTLMFKYKTNNESLVGGSEII